MVSGIVFPFCASMFRSTQLILPITLGSKLFPFSHYILQIWIYMSNIPERYFSASFQIFDLLMPTSWTQNCNQIMRVEQSMMVSHGDGILRSICWCLLACYRLWRHSWQFCQWPIDFLEVWEEQHRYIHSQIHYTVSGIFPRWDHIFQAYRRRPHSPSGTAEINIITRTKGELDFLSSVLQADFYCRDPGIWLTYHFVLYPDQFSQ